MVIKKEKQMKLNPYSVAIILLFSIIVSVTNKTIQNKEYEKVINDSCFYLDDSTGSKRKMWLEYLKTPTVEPT